MAFVAQLKRLCVAKAQLFRFSMQQWGSDRQLADKQGGCHLVVVVVVAANKQQKWVGRRECAFEEVRE